MIPHQKELPGETANSRVEAGKEQVESGISSWAGKQENSQRMMELVKMTQDSA